MCRKNFPECLQCGQFHTCFRHVVAVVTTYTSVKDKVSRIPTWAEFGVVCQSWCRVYLLFIWNASSAFYFVNIFPYLNPLLTVWSFMRSVMLNSIRLQSIMVLKLQLSVTDLAETLDYPLLTKKALNVDHLMGLITSARVLVSIQDVAASLLSDNPVFSQSLSG